MTIAIFEPYVIHPGPGDPLPRIGSGMRVVQVKIGRKWVRVKGPDGRVTRLLLKRWMANVPHVRYTDMSRAEISAALDRWKKS